MAEVHYLISDASKKVDVESHVLRYWEDELELDIPRNDMGHRYYTEYHIRLFRKIKELKEKGYQLKAIKSALNKMTGAMEDITITEDYMEEDMKAAWDEGQVRESEKVWVSEPMEQPKTQEAESMKGQSRPQAPEPISQKGQLRPQNPEPVREQQVKSRHGEGVRSKAKEQSKVRLMEPAGEQPRVRIQEGTTPIASLPKNGRRPEDTRLREMEAVRRKGEALEVNAEKMARFQSVMNHIIGRAIDANLDRLTREVSNTVSEDVTDKVIKEVEYLMRVSDEKEEERFRQLDETIRAYQKQGKGRAEAAATKVPFFKKKKFGKSGKKMF